MIKFEKGKIVIFSETPRLPGINRANRRRLIYGNKNKRLFDKIVNLRKEMKKAGFNVPNMVKSNRRKYLSGYMSELVRIVNGI